MQTNIKPRFKYYHVAKTLIDDFDCFELFHIPRENNTRVDLLSKLANTKKIGHLNTITKRHYKLRP